MDKINMVDLKSQYLRFKEEIDEKILEVINSTSFINGSAVGEFSQNLAGYLNVKSVIPCGNGTDALQIALMSLGLEKNAEVIVPAFTYVASVEVIALLGLKPVFVDVNEDDFNIDVSKIEAAITPKTAAIIPVHLFGQCADMSTVLDIASRHGLKVIEDAAQSLGSVCKINGTTIASGCMGDIGTTSFFPSKNLGCFGDGGAIMTNNEELARRLKQIANHGQEVKYYHDIVGVNSRLDSMQAAILNVKLKHLDEFVEARKVVAGEYDKHLSAIDQLKTPKRVDFSTHSFHQYTLQILDGSRDALKDHLANHKIPSMIYYPVPVHLQKAYQHYGYIEGDFQVSERLSKTVISLPIHTEMEEHQQSFIIEKIREFYTS